MRWLLLLLLVGCVDDRCRENDGVSIQGVCVKKEVVIPREEMK